LHDVESTLYIYTILCYNILYVGQGHHIKELLQWNLSELGNLWIDKFIDISITK
jgi:hypothetical protein